MNNSPILYNTPTLTSVSNKFSNLAPITSPGLTPNVPVEQQQIFSNLPNQDNVLVPNSEPFAFVFKFLIIANIILTILIIIVMVYIKLTYKGETGPKGADGKSPSVSEIAKVISSSSIAKALTPKQIQDIATSISASYTPTQIASGLTVDQISKAIVSSPVSVQFTSDQLNIIAKEISNKYDIVNIAAAINTTDIAAKLSDEQIKKIANAIKDLYTVQSIAEVLKESEIADAIPESKIKVIADRIASSTTALSLIAGNITNEQISSVLSNDKISKSITNDQLNKIASTISSKFSVSEIATKFNVSDISANIDITKLINALNQSQLDSIANTFAQNPSFALQPFTKHSDLILGKDRLDRGDSGPSRALVKDANNTLAINFGNDFKGGVRVDSNMKVTGELSNPRNVMIQSLSGRCLDSGQFGQNQNFGSSNTPCDPNNGYHLWKYDQWTGELRGPNNQCINTKSSKNPWYLENCDFNNPSQRLEYYRGGLRGYNNMCLDLYQTDNDKSKYSGCDLNNDQIFQFIPY